MATIVQQPASDSGGGMGFLLGIVILILFVLGLIFYGLPMIQQNMGGPSITVPEQVDVNINQK
jgi:hypothetical protein